MNKRKKQKGREIANRTARDKLFLPSFLPSKSRDSSVGIALGYGLDDRGAIPGVVGNFSLHHRVHNGSGTHPASYPVGARGSFSGGKAAEA
jgi:hypothetical protein